MKIHIHKMIFHLTWPCAAFLMVLILLFGRVASPVTLLKLSVAFFAGIYIVPMISTDSGFLGYKTNIWLRVFAIVVTVVFAMLFSKKAHGIVFACLLLICTIFNARECVWTRSEADMKFGRERLDSVLGPDVHCVKSNNVYLLVYDSYAHRTVIEGLGIKKDGFIDDILRDNGFTVYDAYTSGTDTLGSMSMAFTLDGISGGSKRSTIGGDNVFSDFLRDAGYRTSYLLCGYTMPEDGERRPGHFYYPERKELSNKDYILLSCIKEGYMRPFSTSFNYYSYDDWVNAYLNVMTNRTPARQFVYAHSSIPDHAAWYPKYRKTDAEEQKLYACRLAQADKAIKDNLNLLKSDKDSIIISESARGEGAKLINGSGEYFAKNYHPLADLAPRDIVTRAICAEIEKTGNQNIFLDMTVSMANLKVK